MRYSLVFTSIISTHHIKLNFCPESTDCLSLRKYKQKWAVSLVQPYVWNFETEVFLSTILRNVTKVFQLILSKNSKSPYQFY